MLALHLAICFIALLAGALVLIALCRGRHQPTWAAVLLLSTALVSLTGFPLPSPPGTPTPDPARVVGVIELVLVLIAAITLYLYHLARFWRAVYLVTITLAVYFSSSFRWRRRTAAANGCERAMAYLDEMGSE